MSVTPYRNNVTVEIHKVDRRSKTGERFYGLVILSTYDLAAAKAVYDKSYPVSKGYRVVYR
jgi:hypothetical protein